MGADHVRVENDISLLSVVGDGMRHSVGIAARVTGAMAASGTNIELIVQGPSELTMILGVKQADAAKAVQAIYHEFFVERKIHLPEPSSDAT